MNSFSKSLARDGALGKMEAPLVGRSAAHTRMLAQLRSIAASDAPALIEGETGSGKEVAARAIHYEGSRHAGPFVPVNCGALPDALVEAELFGHERGAYTDAHRARRGLVAVAAGGTLFLDEVDALSPKAQVTLLRFLQDQHYRPVGTAREEITDVRLIAATNRPLDALVAQQAFRADLMYRLKILYLVLPPLRERGEDIEALARHFVARFSVKYGAPPKDLHPQALAWMQQHDWPGNIRELENWVHRQFLMTPGAVIELEGLVSQAAAPAAELCCYQEAKARALRQFECDYLQRALRQAAGNVTRAAQLAGKERRAFGKLMKKHGLGASASAH